MKKHSKAQRAGGCKPLFTVIVMCCCVGVVDRRSVVLSLSVSVSFALLLIRTLSLCLFSSTHSLPPSNSCVRQLIGVLICHSVDRRRLMFDRCVLS